MDCKTALTCLVPSHFDAIQETRKTFDPAYSRWMPHFNIGCFPFYSPSEYLSQLPVIQEVCSTYSPIPITLSRLSTFPASRNSQGTVYLEVDHEANKINELYTELMTKLGMTNKSNFYPHVTVARFSNQGELEAVRQSMVDNGYCESGSDTVFPPMEFTLEGLDLIIRSEQSAFETRYFFPFGSSEYRCTAPKSSNFAAQVSTFGSYHVFKISTEKVQEVHNKVCNILVIDNSGSMGSATAQAISTIGKGMLNLPVDLIPGKLVLFDSKTSVYDISSADQLSRIALPRQGMTDITGAIKQAISQVLLHSKTTEGSHYVLTFLSDGAHTSGSALTERDIATMRTELDARGILLSIIVVGISDNDTRLGMQIKTGLETVPLHTLNSVYYAKGFAEMNSVIGILTRGCSESLGAGVSTDIAVEGGVLVENNGSSSKTYMSSEHTIVVKATSECPRLFINGEMVELTNKDIDEHDVEAFVTYVLPKLSQMKVAHSQTHIDVQLRMLEEFIDIAQDLLTRCKSEPVELGSGKLSSQARLKMLKEMRRSQVLFQQERNQLLQLKANVSNNSAQQADYLTGFNRKFAGKAVIRSDMVSVSLREVLDDIEGIRDKLIQALESTPDGEETSLLSLNTSKEQLQEWLTFDRSQFTDIYSLLVYFGFSCYPVEFEHNNAVQMDPFQTSCKYIEPYMMDTSSLMLANQIKHSVKSPSGRIITDGLILIDSPASLLLKGTHIYKYLCSVILCRDLYMYHPRMTFSVHAHALKRAIQEFYETKSTAYLNLALKIANSFEMTGEKNSELFTHWWDNWNTITQSAEDNCSHPIQLLMLMCRSDMVSERPVTRENSRVPLFNLLNEVLARKIRIILARYEDPQAKAMDRMQELFGINESNSPTPDPDAMKPEPTLISVRESCTPWADIANLSVLKNAFNADSIEEFVQRELLPYVIMFEFALLRHLPLEELSRRLLETKLELSTEVATTMFVQAVLHHTNQTRLRINEKDVFDPETFKDLIRDMRMAVYFDLHKIKKEEYLRRLGDVTYAEALTADITLFDAMTGTHTHGLTKDRFRAMLEATNGQGEKYSLFLRKSNSSVSYRCVKGRKFT